MVTFLVNWRLRYLSVRGSLLLRLELVQLYSFVYAPAIPYRPWVWPQQRYLTLFFCTLGPGSAAQDRFMC